MSLARHKISRSCGFTFSTSGDNEGRSKMNAKKGKKRTITGTVIPDDWDHQGNVTRVLIKASDYEEYVVEPSRQGKQLLSMTDRTVRVRGTVRERLNGDLTISVDNYKMIHEEEEDLYVVRKDHAD